MQRIDAAIGRRIHEEIERHGDGTKVHSLGLAMGLISLYEGHDYGTYHDKTLREHDYDAYAEIALRKGELDRVVKRLADDPDVKVFLQKARTFGIIDVLGSNFKQEIRKYANYLVSDQFLDELERLSDDAKKARVEKEMFKIGALDPPLAHEVIIEMTAKAAARRIARDPAGVVADLTTEERIAAWDKLLLVLAALKEQELGAGGSAAAQTVGDLKKGAKVYGATKKAVGMLRDVAARARIARALGTKIPNRAFYAALSSEDPTLLRSTQLTAEEQEAASEVIKWAKKYGWIGRGVTTLTTFLSIAGMVTSWPPTDAHGNVSMKKLATLTGSVLSTIGTLPTSAQFLRQDLPKLLGFTLRTEATVPSAVGAAAQTMKVAKTASKFVTFCKVVGPIGDAIFIGVAIVGAFEESANGDAVGMYSKIGQAIGGAIGLVGGIMILAGGAAATGVGIPLALVGAAIGLIAAAIEWGFSESDLTGKVKKDLAKLQITQSESAAFSKLAESRRTEHVYGYWGGPSYDRTYTVRTDHKTVRERAKKATTEEKIGMINTFLNESTSGSEESLIYAVLQETPYTNGEFLDLMERLDCKRIANELERASQAGGVMMWTLRAYELAGKPPGTAFTDQIWQHCEDNDEDALGEFLKVLVDGPSTDRTVGKEIYRKVDPVALCEATKRLAVQSLNQAEAKALVDLLDATSWAQFNQLMEWGNDWYVQQLEKMPWQQWKRLREIMLNANTTPTVKNLANRRSTFNSLTQRSETRTTYTMGGAYTYNTSVERSTEDIRAKAKVANRFEKVCIINGYLNNPNRKQETVIYEVLRETPYERNEFLQVMESLECARVARALEDDGQAANVMMWTLQAYENAGKAAGRAFWDQWEAHCRYQRYMVIDKFLVNVVEGGDGYKTLDRKVYMKLDPGKLYRSTTMFRFDGARDNEGIVIHSVLSRTSWTQFNRIIELGHLSYLKTLKELMPTKNWQTIHDWMTSDQATPAVRHLALQIAR